MSIALASPARIVPLCSVLIALLCLAAAPEAQAQRRAGDARFTPPQGWRVHEQGDGVVRMLSPDENAMLIVMAGERFGGDLREGFDATWPALLQGLGLRRRDGGEAQTGTTVGFESVSTQADLVDGRGNRIVGRYALLRHGEAVVGVALVSSEATFAKHEPAYEQLLGSITLDGKAAVAHGPGQRDGADAGEAGAGGRAADDPPPRLEDPQPRGAQGSRDVDAQEARRLGDRPRAPAEREQRPPRKAPDPPEPHPQVVAGVVSDERGNLLQNGTVTIALSGTTIAGGANTSFNIPVDMETGVYSQQVPDGLYTTWAFLETEYNGRRYRVRLAPTDDKPRFTEFASSKGVVRNFVWKISGLEPGADESVATSYYGAKVMLLDENGYQEGQRLADRYPGGEVIVRLEPDGPLMDGSEGRPITLRSPTAQLQAMPHFPDVPLGKYIATAKLVTPQGREIPLAILAHRMHTGEEKPPFGAEATVEFTQASLHDSISTVQLVVRE